MKTILVVANETIGGASLFDAVKARVDEAGGDARVVACVPQGTPKHGNVIYDEAVHQAAQVRIDLARQVLRESGIDAIGDVGDPDPYTAAMDAVREHHPDEIIVSTYPATSSGWLRRDLVERIEDGAGVPVQHVVVDLDAEGLPYDVTLVVANRTAASDDLLERLKGVASQERQRLFICVVPQEGGDGLAARRAQARLTQILDRVRSAGLLCAGMIGDPDPYTAVQNAVQFFRVDDILISTLPATRSGWLRADLIQRVQSATRKPVTHVEVRASSDQSAAA
jgi:hypothetical protein